MPIEYIGPNNQVINPNTSEGKRELIQQEALRSILLYNRGGLDISMGVGKTYIGLQYIKIVQGKVLVVAPKVSIFESWKNDAIKFNLEPLLDTITFSTYLSLNKHNPNDYDIIVLDEAHNVKYSHEEFLSEYQGNILGLTGTPPRFKNSEKGEMMFKYYPIRYTYSVDEAVGNDILNDYRIYVHTLSLSSANNMPVGRGNKKWMSSEFKQYHWISSQIESSVGEKQLFINRINRINYLKGFQTKIKFANYISSKIPTDEKCLFFMNTKEQADNFTDCTHHSGNHKNTNKENLDKFSNGEVFRLAAVEQLSEGITIPNLKHIVILHSYGNEKRASQKIGRALRLNPNEVAKIHVLCYKNTVDEDWVSSALSDFDPEKITWKDYN
jgi:superfamily II DNA or RNA helicase